MANWYCGRRAVKVAAGINGGDQDPIVDRLIEAASRRIDQETRRRFIPETATRLYRWPHRLTAPTIFWLDQDLLSVTTLLAKAQDTTPTTIATADYFLEPQSLGPPYNRIEIDLSSSAAFEAGDTPQRSISVAGTWGYGNSTKAGGTVASGLASDATATTFVCSNSALIDVGDTLLIQSEQLFVSGMASAVLGTILLNGALTATKSQVSVTVDGSHGIVAGEVILVDSEKMFVEAVSTNVLTVVRAYDGSTLAAHADDTPVHIYRTLTVVRGVNGTTGAVHADATAISLYVPPLDITNLCLAETIAMFSQERAQWGRELGGVEGATELTGRALTDLRRRVTANYRRVREAAI
mgnify:FL=1